MQGRRADTFPNNFCMGGNEANVRPALGEWVGGPMALKSLAKHPHVSGA